MSDHHDRARSVPIPPGSIYDNRLTDFDRRILAVLCDRADWKTMTTDTAQVQVVQAINSHLRSVNRAFGRLFKAGYITSHGHNRHNAHRLQINLDVAAGETAGSQSGETAGSQSGETVGSQSGETAGSRSGETVQASLDPGVSEGETLQAYSSPSLSTKQTNRRAQAREADGSCEPGSYWTLPLEAIDLEAGTLLTQEGRNLGFARINGRDGLQEQYRHFTRHRAKRNYRNPANRSEFRTWLRKAAEQRSDLTATAEETASAEASKNPPGDDLEIPASMRRRERKVNLAPSLNGSTALWRAAWIATLDSIAKEFGDAIADNWFQPAILEHGAAGRAVVRMALQASADRARRDWGDYLARAWAARVPGGEIVILGPRDKEQPA